MKRVLLLGLLFGGIVMCGAPAFAAGRAPVPAVERALPFPRSPRAESVWANDACWRGCQSTCTWDLAGCLKVDTQGRCLQQSESCDRACQRDCRSRGGPYLPVE